MANQDSNEELRRKQLLINPHFQLSFIGYTVATSLIVVGLFFGAQQIFFWKFAEYGKSIGLPESHIFFTFLREQENQLNLIFAVVAGVVTLGLTLAGVLFSHKIAGPLHRLKSHFTQVAHGLTIDDVRFRKGDFFQDVAEAYNIQMASIREKEVSSWNSEKKNQKTG